MHSKLFTLSSHPPPAWESNCARENATFYSSAWQTLLSESFGCTPVFGSCSESEGGIVIPVFHIWLFRFGYLGFPVGGALGPLEVTDEILMSWRSTHKPTNTDPHCLRIPISAFDQPTNTPCLSNGAPETAIVDLQNWSISRLRKCERDVKRAKSFGITLRPASTSSDGQLMYRMYKETVDRYSGNLRYNQKYFAGLVNLSLAQPSLRCLIANKDGEAISFLVAILHKDTAYYLHGGTRESFKRYSPTDLLLNEAILWAKNSGLSKFNFMSSPQNQPSLTRYKEKWGGVTRLHYTQEFAFDPVMCKTFHIGESIHQRIRRIVAISAK